LRVVADAVRAGGRCELSVPEIAARAGVGITTARNAIRDASRDGLLTIQERRRHHRPNLPNVVRVISREWLAWISKGGNISHTRDEGVSFSGAAKNLVHSTKD
jgi:hypothetical protein